MQTMDIGGKIRQARGAMTQRRLAELAGMDPGHLCRIERGDIQPRWETVENLARTLGVALTAGVSDHSSTQDREHDLPSL